MKESYIATAFRQTIAERFPKKENTLRIAFEQRMAALWAENENATPETQRHLEAQIVPGIAAYEVLQTVMPKEEALRTIHGYVEVRAWKIHAAFEKLLRIPGLWRAVPHLMAHGTRKMFGETAGFAAEEHQTSDGVWRIDMLQCPYHDACVRYGCPELCPCFCDSDDITYDNIHRNLAWHRTKTLGRGDDCCDFCLKIKGKGEQKP